MKIVGFLSVAVCAALFATACGDRRQDAVPVAEFPSGGLVIPVGDSLSRRAEPDTIDMGRIAPGEVIEGGFTLENTGNKAFVIVGVRTSCGCTSTDFRRDPVLPGEKAGVYYRFDSRGFSGYQMKSLTVRLSTGGRPVKVILTAQIAER